MRQGPYLSGRRPGTLVILAAAALVLGLYAASASCGAPLARADPTWTRIQEERVLAIGIDPSFPPFEADDGQGNLAGSDIRLAQALARRWSEGGEPIRIQYVYTGFDGLYEALRAKQFDIILSALPYNPAKTEEVNFSHAYYDGGPVIVAHPTVGGRKLALQDLAGQIVAIELGSGADALIRKWSRRLNFRPAERETTSAAIEAVRKGEAGGALVDTLSFWEYERADPNNGLRIASDPLEHDYAVMAVRKDSPTLLRNLNTALDAWTRDGSLERMQREALASQ